MGIFYSLDGRLIKISTPSRVEILISPLDVARESYDSGVGLVSN